MSEITKRLCVQSGRAGALQRLSGYPADRALDGHRSGDVGGRECAAVSPRQPRLSYREVAMLARFRMTAVDALQLAPNKARSELVRKDYIVQEPPENRPKGATPLWRITEAGRAALEMVTAVSGSERQKTILQ